MPLNLSERELQDLVIKSLKANTFQQSIKGVEVLKKKLAHDNSSTFIPSFLVDFKLEQEYARGALEVLNALEQYKIINGESIRSISLEVNDRNVNQRLHPDIILFNEKTRQLVIVELKIEGNAEREAVTELAAFVQEVKNHLPFSSDLDVALVVIAESYKTLLNHAVAGLSMDTRYNILCLRPEIDPTGNLEFHVHAPISAWTDIGQSFSPKNTFLSKTIFLKERPLPEIYRTDLEEVSQVHWDSAEMAIDLLMHQAMKFGTHGFVLLCGREIQGRRHFAININLLNPFVFLQFALDHEMSVNDKEPLTAYLKEKHLGDDKIQESVSLERIVEIIRGDLEEVFEVSESETTTYHENMIFHGNFRRQFVPLSFDSWGSIGDYVRYLYRHPAFKKHYFGEHGSVSPLAFKQPYLGLQIINLITGNYLFRNGGFNATDTYHFCRLLDFYVQRQMELLKGLTPRAEQDCTLIYTNLDLAMALKEFNIRINMVDDEQVRSCPAITLNVGKANHDFLYEFKEFSGWHVNRFTSQSAIINKLLIKCCHDAAAYFNVYSFRRDIVTAVHIADFMKDVLFDYISNAHLLMERAGSPNADLIIDKTWYPGFCKNNANEALQAIMKMEDNALVSSFDPHFLAFADEVIDEVFHVLPLPAENFKDVDWCGIRNTIINRNRRGDTFLAVSIDSAGNFGISKLPESGQKMFPKDIVDYSQEVFFVNEMAGLGVFYKAKWFELENGSFFD